MNPDRDGAGDEGSVLLMALFFLTALTFLVIVPLGYADASLRATHSLDGDQGLEYAARGALDKVVDAVRTRPDQAVPYQGAAGAAQPCPWTASPRWPAGLDPAAIALNGVVVSVSCVGLVPAAGPLVLERDAVFTVTCVSVPAGTCPTGPLLRGSYSFYDLVGDPGNMVAVRNWSEAY